MPIARAAGSRPAITARGPISEAVCALLTAPPHQAPERPEVGERVAEMAAAVSDPLGDDDLHLALYVCLELHYRGFEWADDAWEWDPTVVAITASLSSRFLAEVEKEVGTLAVDPSRVGELLFDLEAADEGPSLSRFIETDAGLDQFREFVAHRSLYQLKEADPHSWAIPRLTGPAKSALLEVQADEYGGGRPERIHSALFAKTMRALGMEDRENAYLDRVPGVTIATVNLMSALGIARARRGAIVGHLAMFEMTSAQPNRRYANGLRRLGFGADATDFYDEHVEADAVHENIAAYDLAGGLARQEPELAEDIVFGARALLHLEARFARHLLDSWEAEQTSLLRRP